MAKVTAKKVVKKRREKKNIEKGAVHIQATFNNTIVTISDVYGNTISWASAGELGFKGSRKSSFSISPGWTGFKYFSLFAIFDVSFNGSPLLLHSQHRHSRRRLCAIVD